jgi:hypothetical protein
MMNSIFTYFIICYSCFYVCVQACPVLDPFDPQYAWMDELIEQDFSDKKIITRKQLERTVRIYKKNSWFQHLRVHNNQVIGSSEPNDSFFKMIVYLCEQYGLPDLDLICYVHDGLKNSPKGDVPIFTRCRRKGIKNTLLFSYMHSIEWAEDQWSSVEKSKSIPWDMLIKKVHWRGNATDGHEEYGGCYSVNNWSGHPRGKACFLTSQFPDLIDAAFVLEPQFGLCEDQKILLNSILPQAPRTSVETCLNYKYQLLISGIVSPWTSDWKIIPGRVIFQHQMPWEVYWDSLFKPWEHYIPVAADFSDFVDRVIWAYWHDETCKNIAVSSRIFMENHARPEHAVLYCYKALLKYADLLGPEFSK